MDRKGHRPRPGNSSLEPKGREVGVIPTQGVRPLVKAQECKRFNLTTIAPSMERRTCYKAVDSEGQGPGTGNHRQEPDWEKTKIALTSQGGKKGEK